MPFLLWGFFMPWNREHCRCTFQELFAESDLSGWFMELHVPWRRAHLLITSSTLSCWYQSLLPISRINWTRIIQVSAVFFSVNIWSGHYCNRRIILTMIVERMTSDPRSWSWVSIIVSEDSRISPKFSRQYYLSRWYSRSGLGKFDFY